MAHMAHMPNLDDIRQRRAALHLQLLAYNESIDATQTAITDLAAQLVDLQRRSTFLQRAISGWLCEQQAGLARVIDELRAERHQLTHAAALLECRLMALDACLTEAEATATVRGRCEHPCLHDAGDWDLEMIVRDERGRGKMGLTGFYGPHHPPPIEFCVLSLEYKYMNILLSPSSLFPRRQRAAMLG